MPERPQPVLPRSLILGCAAVAMIATAVAIWGSPEGGPAQDLPAGAPVATRLLNFADNPAGGVDVIDASTGAVIQHLGRGEGGFIRGAMRGFARERRKFELGPGAEFRLSGWANGRLTLEDPATRRIIELTAFGADNAAAFRRYLGGPERG